MLDQPNRTTADSSGDHPRWLGLAVAGPGPKWDPNRSARTVSFTRADRLAFACGEIIRHRHSEEPLRSSGSKVNALKKATASYQL